MTDSPYLFPFWSLTLFLPLTAVVKDSPVPRRLEMPSFTPPGHLDPTIYPTEVGVSSVSGRETEVHMLSTAFKITLDPQRNVKVTFISSHFFFEYHLLIALVS